MISSVQQRLLVAVDEDHDRAAPADFDVVSLDWELRCVTAEEFHLSFEVSLLSLDLIDQSEGVRGVGGADDAELLSRAEFRSTRVSAEKCTYLFFRPLSIWASVLRIVIVGE